MSSDGLPAIAISNLISDEPNDEEITIKEIAHQKRQQIRFYQN